MNPVRAQPEDFSLVAGGPLYRLLLKARLVRPPLELVLRRVVVLPALAWLPLLALSLAEGRALGGVRIPFLVDIEAYARFLVAMPSLLFAELIVHRQLQSAVEQFRERGLIAPAGWPRFEAAIASTIRLRDSVVAEIVILLLVYAIGPWTWRTTLLMPADTWYADSANGEASLTRAGWWLIYVSAPMFQFLLVRWYFRLLLWWLFLWRVSRLPLELVPTHPDRSAGLGFLGDSLVGFVPLLFGEGALVSGLVASRVLTGTRDLLDYRAETLVLIVLLVAVTVVPLLFFMPQLLFARRMGLRRFDLLSTTYVRTFERKWLDNGAAPPGEPLIGTSDLQSLADLGSSSDVVHGMKTVPVGARILLLLAAAAAAPFVPLVLTVIPLLDLVGRVLGMIL